MTLTRTAAASLAAALLVLVLASPALALVTAPVVHIDASTGDPVGHVVRLVLLGATLLGLAGLTGLYLTRGR